MAILTMMHGKMVVEPQSEAEAKELEAMAYKSTKVDVEKKEARKSTPKAKAEKADD